MTVRILCFLLIFSALNIYAQKTNPSQTDLSSSNQNSRTSDELLKHLSAAETYQISGDLVNAAVENRAIVGIGLERVGNIAIEEGNYEDAVRLLSESLTYADTAPGRTNLAVAYQRLNQIDKAVAETRNAIAIDPKYQFAHYILGNIYFVKEDYQAALPELEKVMLLAPDFDAAQALGLTYLYLKRPERAKLLFEELQISAGKESPELHILFGQAYEQTNYPLEAEREFRRALEINPKQPRASFFLGYVILQHGGSDRLAEAGKAFDEELKLSPDDFYSNFFAGVVASSENDHQKAVGYFEKSVKIRPESAESFLFLGGSQFELNNLVEAEKNLRQAIRLVGTDKEKELQSRRTHFLLGRLLVKTGRKEEGQKELDIARALQEKSIQTARDEINQILGQVVGTTGNKAGGSENPTPEKIALTPERAAEFAKIKKYLAEILAQAFHNLGVIAVQNGQTAEALEKFAAASSWKPDFPGLDRNWGIVGFRAGQYERAVAPLARQLKANPKDDLVRQMLGASYYFTGNFAGAAEVLKPFEPVITSNAELAYFYGLSLIQLKRNQEAVPIFDKLAAVSQNNAEALFSAAQGFMIMGDYERSVKEFRRVTTLNPNVSKANYFIGQSLIRLNRFDEAEKAFSRELELNPTDVLSKYHLAVTLIERRIETERTIALLEETISLKSDYADARYQLGKIFLERGEIAKAIEQLETAVSAEANKDYIHYQLSIAYRKASRRDDADRELKRYQELKAASRKNDSPMGNNENSPK
ncbi:MAG: tetratricopeptide repeat protein [Acidobacteria bacterium]|nr:tetratricopeptide repeat protein [Acidobacteriota bacterium]